jgi:hypothetical protein
MMGFHMCGNKSIQGPNAFHRIHFAFQHPFHSKLDLIFINHLIQNTERALRHGKHGVKCRE